MKPKFKYPVAEKANIPAEFLPFYKEANGFLVLDIDGAADADRLAEFRNNNTTLQTQLEAVAAAATGKTAAEFRGAKYEAILPEVTTAREALQSSGTAKGKQEVEEASKAQIEALKQAHLRELSTRDERIKTQSTELSRLKIDHKVLELGTAAGLLPTAADDLAARAARVFSLDDAGKIVAKGPDGNALFDSNAEPMTPEKWIEGQRTAAAHLFKPAQGSETPGGGAGGGGGNRGAATGANPWDPKTINRTEQSKMYKKDPALAIRMAAQHNVRLVMPTGK